MAKEIKYEEVISDKKGEPDDQKLYDRVKAELDDCRNPSTTTTVPPTLIEMSSLSATPANQKVKLEWKTESEIDNAGFNVWRAESENGEYQKINEKLISAYGSATEGAIYEYIDSDVRFWKTYWYKLEDIDTSGIRTFHDPVKAVPRWFK